MDLIQDVTMASLEIEVIMKLFILASEYSLYFDFRGDKWRHLSLLCWQISSWTLVKPPPYAVLDSLLVSGADSWTMWFAFENTV